MEVICISDNLETAIGLRFSGINTIVINNREEINNNWSNKQANKSFLASFLIELFYGLLSDKRLTLLECII